MTISEAALMAQRWPQGWDSSKALDHLNKIQPKIVILKTLWYPEIVDALEASAREYLISIGLADSSITTWQVPGSFELPLASQWAFEGSLRGQKAPADWVIALGCVLKGGTPHFDFVCQATSQALMQIQSRYSKPFGFGVLTVNSLSQALERKNKGAEAAQAAVLMALLKT